MDIRLTPTGLDFTTDLSLTESRVEKVAQRLYVRFKTQLGTWFFNTDYGVDYLGSILGKGRTKLSIDAIIRSEILKEVFVDSILSFESSISDRKYTCRFTVKAVGIVGSGEVLSFLLNENGLLLTDQDGNIITF